MSWSKDVQNYEFSDLTFKIIWIIAKDLGFRSWRVSNHSLIFASWFLWYFRSYIMIANHQEIVVKFWRSFRSWDPMIFAIFRWLSSCCRDGISLSFLDHVIPQFLIVTIELLFAVSKLTSTYSSPANEIKSG